MGYYNYYCSKCKEGITEKVYEYSSEHCGRILCLDCQKKANNSQSIVKENNLRKIQCIKCGKECIISKHEDKLTKALKGRRIEVQQQKCVPIQLYPYKKHIDLVILSHNLNIEVDGDTHQTIKQKRSDYKRDKHSAKKGFDTIRVTNGDIDYDIEDVLDYIEEIMDDIEEKDKNY